MAMKEYIYKTFSEEDTKVFSEKLASKLDNNSVIVLSGDLGAGKTKFTEGFLKHFGLENEISSPTFTIINEYSKNDTRIYHFDVYRLEGIDEFYEIGGDEYFNKGICIIEWGELIKDALPPQYIHISISKDENDLNLRIINVKVYGSKYEEIFETI